MAILSFRRIEKKYIVNEEQKRALISIISEYMDLDPFCKNESTYRIQNIYYDTPTNELISLSVRKPRYKQKLRARKYLGNNKCYLEIKKKCEGVVGKRRISLTNEELEDFVYRGIKPIRESFIDNHVIGEIEYLLSLYKVQPSTFISYERLGFFARNDHELRLTFDNKIHAKRNNFEWDKDDYEIKLLEDGLYILEIKYIQNFPLWLTKALSKLKIYPHSFSKYGTEYLNRVKGKKEYETI